MQGILQGRVVNIRSGRNGIVVPDNGKKYVQVKLPEGVGVNSRVDFAVTAYRPDFSTEIGCYVNGDFRYNVEIVDVVMHNHTRSDFSSCQVIPEMRMVPYTEMFEFYREFKRTKDTCLMFIGENEYFSLYRIRLPFIVTDKNHAFYQKRNNLNRQREYRGNELLAILNMDSCAKIDPGSQCQPGNAYVYEDAGLEESYPFLRILPVVSDNRPYAIHVLIGQEAIRKQLGEWGVEIDRGVERILGHTR